MGNVNMEACQINYRGGEKKMSVEEVLKNTSGEAAAIAQLQTDVLNLNSNKANQITIAPFFSAEASYDPGDLVYYNGLSYRCVNAHEGEWDADNFAATTIAGELDSLKSGLTEKQNIYGNAVKIGEIAVNATYVEVIATKNGYLSVVYEMSSVNMNIKGKIRDAFNTPLGASFDITADAYTSEPLCVVPCRTGGTYAVSAKAGHNGISIYQF